MAENNKKIEGIQLKIKALNHMRDLKVEDFAVPDTGWAYVLAKGFGNNLNSTQLRRFFGNIKNAYLQLRKRAGGITNDALPPDIRSEMSLMLPTLAYAKARKLIPLEFYEIVRECLSQTRLATGKDLERVAQFMEAIVAYQKFIASDKSE